MSNANPSVNRYLKDKAMEYIDHALGRPVEPLAPTFRNHFATDATGQRAAEFLASPYWKPAGLTGDMAFFSVTEEGRRALAAHLKAIGDPHRPYAVTYEGTTSIVPAKSASAAKYALYLQISDCFCDLRFRDFVGKTRAVLAARSNVYG